MGQLNHYLETVKVVKVREKKELEGPLSSKQLYKITRGFRGYSSFLNIQTYLQRRGFKNVSAGRRGIIGKGEDAYPATMFTAKYGDQKIYGIASGEPGVFDLSDSKIEFIDYD